MLIPFLNAGLYLHTVTETKLVVDTSRGEKLHINVKITLIMLSVFDSFEPPVIFFTSYFQFDITFPAVSCTLLSLDAMDISGEQHLDIVCLFNKWSFLVTLMSLVYWYKFNLQRHDIIKKRIDSSGKVIEERKEGIGGPQASSFFRVFIGLYLFWPF